jgi:hypothetical protein
MRTASIIRAMTINTVNTSEMSVYFYKTTRRNIQKAAILVLASVRI